jgi:hypothetical protein
MKTDLVLTTDEYLTMCCDNPKHVNPPARDAHHIPITAEHDFVSNNEPQACRCDRWGHPCPGCAEHAQEQCAPVQDFAKKEPR